MWQSSHALQLLVNGPNVLEVLNELHHHGAVRQGEELRILKVSDSNAPVRSKRHVLANVDLCVEPLHCCKGVLYPI